MAMVLLLLGLQKLSHRYRVAIACSHLMGEAYCLMKLKKTCTWLALISALATAPSFAASTIRINEFAASNSSGLADEDGEFSDWIELHNFGTEPVMLDEWHLTDDPDVPAMWEFPLAEVPPGGYLVVFASGKNRNSPNLHANFNLSQTGEYLALRDREGNVVTEFAPAYPEQRTDVSFGFDANGNLNFFTSPTPDAANQGGVLGYVEDTKFSHDRGFYEAPFDLVITSATPGATIRYTTNGVPPTATTGTVYAGPLRITGTTVLRAAAFKEGMQPSNADTQTYLFLDDVIRQSANGAPPPGWPSSWGANTVDYGMDPDIVNDPRYRDTIKQDLKTIPSFSVVLRLADLFDSRTGIYANPGQDGRAWERPCSLELIYPDGTKGFQEDAGIRIRGGFSRSTGNPKHAFRLFFRSEYGAGKLEYPLFGESGAQEFDKFDLRTTQNYSWSFMGDGNNLFLRDQFSRDTQLAMGHHAERGDIYHLYINGVYWGLYNTCERPEAAYGESYFGGVKEDYDTVKVDAGPYSIYATDGNMSAWNALYNLARSGLSTEAAYQRLQGNHPDGTPNPAYPVLIDVPNLIDYMLIIIYGGNLDAPISNFLGNDRPNNWFGIRNRNIDTRMGFKFFAHDSEHTLLPWDVNVDRTGPFAAGDTSVTYSNPQWVWKQLTANPEFRMKVADHVHKHFFNDGVLTPQATAARFMKRTNEIDRAVVGESARWGDAKRSTPFRREDWLSAVNNVLNNYFPRRSQIVLNQLRGDNLYPSIAAPSFNQHGGNVDEGFSLTMSAGAGTIYYTLDGSDPRLTGGALSSKAVRYNGAITLENNAVVKARVRSGNDWSALNEAEFRIIRTFKELMITEIMYNPLPEGNIDGDEFEFLELKNAGSEELDLSGISFSRGIDYVFPNGTRLAAGGIYLLVKNPEQFAARYPGVRVDGTFTNSLANSGEWLATVHAAGAPIQEFEYDDANPWPTSADGSGFSLVPKSLNIALNYSDAANWRASARTGGSPGADDPPVNIPLVVINEILTHTDAPAVDSIELYNSGSEPADISGWFLSDSLGSPAKYQIPGGTTIPAGGYLVLTEEDFNPNPGSEPSFSLNSHGEQVYLSSATTEGELTGYTQGFEFGGAANGVSFGRYTNSVGEVLYPAQSALTLGAANSGPRVGPVVINEIRYHPSTSEDEFIELKNITASAVKLYDPENPSNTWQINGVGFVFPEGVEIPPGGVIVISAVEPDLFRSHARLPVEIPVYGPFSGNLQDNGERLELLRPDGPDEEGGVVTVPYIVVDAVRYGAQTPWPVGIAGTALSLERLAATEFGNDPLNWRASPLAASPGLNNDGNRLPIPDAGADIEVVSAAFPHSVEVTGSAIDDGLPNPPAQLAYTWSQVSGPATATIQNANQATATVGFPGVGEYVLRLTVSDGEYLSSDERTVSITRPLEQTAFVATGASWKYLDDGSDQGVAWIEPDFNDANWGAGPSPLGYGDPVTTPVDFGPNSGDKYPTTYFRHDFTVNGVSSVASLNLKLMRDDGAIVYLNGREIFRSNMPEGAVDYRTYSSGVVGGGDETTYFETEVDPSLLREGRNVLAIELHQTNPGSSDLRMDLILSGLVDFSNKAPTSNAGPDVNVEQPASVVLLGKATDDGLPNPPGVFSATWSIISGPGSVTFSSPNMAQTEASFTEPGEYVLRLSVTDGQFTATDDVRVTVTGGIDPYAVWQEGHFTADELTDPVVSGRDADPDGDLFNNEQEFIAGTNPRDARSHLRVAEVARAGDDFAIRFQAVGDKSYTVQGRSDSESGLWQRVLDLSPQGTTTAIEVLDPSIETHQRRFYRLVTPRQDPLE